MKEIGNRRGKKESFLPLPSYSDLRGRQSVRATFRLSERAIDAVSIVSTHLGIKQKSLFDHLIDDIRALDLISREIERDRFNKLTRIQKTFVLSRRTLSCLEDASKKFDAPRDALVEYSLQRLLPIIEKEREKHRKRNEILDAIAEYMMQGDEILKKAKDLLGDDDPVFDRFKTAVDFCHSVHRSIELFIEKGKIIEEFD